jgi:hypothetical protein
VIRGALGVAGYRLRATFRHRWGGYLSLVILVALIGGLGLGSLAGARGAHAHGLMLRAE